MHKIEIDPDLIARLTAERGGKLHIFDRLDPARTAHVVIDMQNGFMAPGAPVEVPAAREIVPHINAIADAVRQAGGMNVFVQFTTPAAALEQWSSFYSRFPAEVREAHQRAFAEGASGWQLWPELDVRDGDRVVQKGRFSAFTPGTSELDAVLRARDIDTLIITGALTNCCCESTARDAMQWNYRVIFASDANAALSDREHNATLNNMCALFADVMSTDEICEVLASAMAPSAYW